MDEIKILERYYDGFINQETPSAFFNGFTDYFEYANDLQAFEYVVTLLLEKGNPLKDEVSEKSRKAIARLDAVRKGVGEYIDRQKIVDTNIKELFLDYDVVRARNNNNTSYFFVKAMHEKLSKVFEILYSMPDCKPHISSYIVYEKGTSITVKQFLSLIELRDVYLAKEEYESAEKSELWGQVPLLYQIFQIIKEGKKQQLALSAGKKIFSSKGTFDLPALNILVGEWEEVRDGKPHTVLGVVTNKKPTYFDVQKIRPIVVRLHLYFIKENAEYEFLSERMKERSEKPAVPEKVVEKIDSAKTVAVPELPSTFAPKLTKKGKVAYLQIYKRTPSIRVARADTRQVKLVQCLFSPENLFDVSYVPIFQNYDRVFDAIRLEKDNKNNLLTDSATAKNAKQSIIQWTIKELQKNKKLTKFLRFEWRVGSSEIRMNIIVPEGKK